MCYSVVFFFELETHQNLDLVSAPVPAAKPVDNQPDTTKSADPKNRNQEETSQAHRVSPTWLLPQPIPGQEETASGYVTRLNNREAIQPKGRSTQVTRRLALNQERTTHQTLPPPREVKEGEAKEEELEVVIEEPPRVLNKAQQDARAIFKATKAAYLNAKNYDEMDLLKSYLEQVISLFRLVQKFLPWKEILTKHLDGWNPYTERKHIKVLKNNKKPIKEKNERDPKKTYKIPKINCSNPKALGSKPYKRKPKTGANKWKETFKMARVLMEVTDAIEE
ncbi:hypothetical protein PTTG_29909 [Puccinia triticina 1-1 BBBD Race 1]|uniref:Uncharacterized protein n=1 Tax=Puccinia triticina (isolate 1-1 / race 1 (BBBD)) TaxID=630390 RepID=A0A180G1E8_PUCT1|nr:hypothetical protein PTTG_29909 [Puccinia triticina 1-1 BBBD Race 1]